MKELKRPFIGIAFAGAREEIAALIRDCIPDETAAAQALDDCPAGPYTVFEMPNSSLQQYEGLVKGHPRCEALNSGGEGTIRHYSELGSDTGVWEDLLPTYSQFFEESVSDWEALLLYNFPQRVSAEVIITRRDGTSADYKACDDLLKRLDQAPGGPTLGALAQWTNPYVMRAKSREHTTRFRKENQSTANIRKLQVRVYFSQRPEENRFPQLAALPGASALCDVTAFRFFRSTLETMVRRTYDFDTMTMEETVFTTAHVPQNPAQGHYDYVDVELDRTNSEPKPFAVAPLEEADLVWSREEPGLCLFCLSDADTIRVPEQDPTGAPVTALDEGSFAGLTNVTRVILPDTVASIGQGAFAGCKKLEYLSRYSDPDSKEDFLLTKKKDLLTLFTKKTSYIVPKSVTKIGKYAFSNCNKLKSVTLHGGLKPLLKDSLAGCKSLKTVVLATDVTAVNVAALEKGGIKEVVLPDGTSIKIQDPCQYACFTQDESGVHFSYELAAQNWQKAKSESSRFKVVMDLLTAHSDAAGKQLSPMADYAIRYCIGKGDVKNLSALLELGLSLNLDFSALVELANRAGNAEISAMLLAQSNAGENHNKMVLRQETPAQPGKRLYIKVRFENNKSYSYFCDYQVKPGDKVFVGGKMAGQPGEVVEIIPKQPSGTAAFYTQTVTEAFTVQMEEVDDLFTL